MSKEENNFFYKSYIFHILTFVMFVNIIAGCKVKGLISKKNEDYMTVEQIIQVNRKNEEIIENVWIKKIRGVYFYDNEDIHFNSNIRIIKDSIIIISIATDFGIEAMRIYVEKDKLTIINRFHKTWYSGSISEKQKIFGLIYNFDFIEKILLMGVGEKVIYEMKGKLGRKVENLGYCYTRNEKEKAPKESFCFDQNSGYLKQRFLEVNHDDIELLIEYSGYEESNYCILPGQINARFKNKEKEHKLLLYYDRWVVNEKFPAKVKISNSYKRVDRLGEL